MTTMVVTMGTLSLATRIYHFNLLFIRILYSFAISSSVKIKVAFLIGGNRFDDAQNELLKGIKIGVVGASLRACFDARYPSIVGVISMWFIGVTLAWFLGLNLVWGLVGIWLAISIDDVFRGISNMHRWNTKKWQSKGLFATDNKKSN